MVAQTSRDLVLCFDGTSNEFGKENTNVVRLVQSLVRDPERQLVFYDPGIGTLPEPGLVTGIGKKLSEIAGLAFGIGLNGKITGGYRYLMENWRPGDRVFIFGFSRGAYTARALAALLHMYGLLPAGNQNLLPYLMRKFMASSRAYRVGGTAGGTAGAARPGVEPEGPYKEFCASWRDTFAHDVPDHPDRRFPVHFLGVWDTVKSVGWVWEPLSLPFTAFNPSVRVVRHAIAVDERRAFFRQNRFTDGGAGCGQDLVERWFAGVHADVGGGYPVAQGGLWRVALCWMVEAAEAQGLAIDAERLDQVLRGLPASAARVPSRSVEEVLRGAADLKAWAEPAHESLTGAWWPGEYFPKMVGTRVQANGQWVWKNRPRMNRGGWRRLSETAVLDASVVERIHALPDYRPRHAEAAVFPQTSAGHEAKAKIGQR